VFRFVTGDSLLQAKSQALQLTVDGNPALRAEARLASGCCRDGGLVMAARSTSIPAQPHMYRVGCRT